MFAQMTANPNLVALSIAARRYAASVQGLPTVNPRLLRAAAICVQAAAVKAIASSLGTVPLATQLSQRADLTISNITDDFCGTNFPLVPKPFPGPRGPALDLATLLTVYANTSVQPGVLQGEIMAIATILVQKAYQNDGLGP
jgi:hypothetical protein